MILIAREVTPLNECTFLQPSQLLEMGAGRQWLQQSHPLTGFLSIARIGKACANNSSIQLEYYRIIGSDLGSYTAKLLSTH